MKNVATIFLSVVYISLNAQTTQIGKQLVGVSSNGSLYRSPSGQPLFESPLWSGLTTIFESQFWVGYTQNGQKHGIMPLISSTGISNQSVYGPQCSTGASEEEGFRPSDLYFIGEH